MKTTSIIGRDVLVGFLVGFVLLDLYFNMYVLSIVVCPFVLFSFGHCVVCSSSIYGFWLPLWHLWNFPNSFVLSLIVICLAYSMKGEWISVTYLLTNHFKNPSLIFYEHICNWFHQCTSVYYFSYAMGKVCNFYFEIIKEEFEDANTKLLGKFQHPIEKSWI
jgi:hypothetical protein